MNQTEPEAQSRAEECDGKVRTDDIRDDHVVTRVVEHGAATPASDAEHLFPDRDHLRQPSCRPRRVPPSPRRSHASCSVYAMTITLDIDASTSDAPTRRSLSNLSLAVAKCKKIVVVTGAGISCSCGIPVRATVATYIARSMNPLCRIFDRPTDCMLSSSNSTRMWSSRDATCSTRLFSVTLHPPQSSTPLSLS